MPLDGYTELSRIGAALGRDVSGVVGVEIDAFSDGRAFLTEHSYDVRTRTIVQTYFQLPDATSTRIYTAFANHYGITTSNTISVHVEVFIGNDVLMRAEFNPPPDVTAINWVNVFAE